MKLQEYSLSKNGEIILQLRGVWIFFPVSSLEVNMKNTDLNDTSARGFDLFLLIIQELEQTPTPNIFPNYSFWLFLILSLCSHFT